MSWGLVEAVSATVGKEFRNIAKIFRFYIVLRQFNYVDPLIYAVDANYIKDVITQALRDYVSYMSSATNRTVKLYYRKEEKKETVPCLVIVKKGDMPSTFLKAYPDVVHEIENSDELCVSPIRWTKDGRPVVVTPKRVEDFLKKVEEDISYARSLISVALGG